MQSIVGILLIAVGIILTKGIMEEGAKKRPQATQVTADATERAPQQTEVQDGQMKIYIPSALLTPDSKPLAIVAGASREYGVPPEVLLAHWYLESGIHLGGGGVGRYSALQKIISKQSEPSERHRWHRFVLNEQALLKICAHCNYDCEKLRGSKTGALGPMQFQPDTWVGGAVDADGDGKACPLNLADAMYTAARKLANDYHRTGSWNGAILAYAGGDCSRNRAYVRRAQPLLRYFRKFWENRMPALSSN